MKKTRFCRLKADEMKRTGVVTIKHYNDPLGEWVPRGAGVVVITEVSHKAYIEANRRLRAVIEILNAPETPMGAITSIREVLGQ